MKKFKAAFIYLIIISISVFSVQADTPGPHEIKAKENFAREITNVEDRAIGLMDKGQLTNLISNFGIISDFHFGSPALHWPRTGTDVQQYGFGVYFLMIADGEVIKSIHDPSSATLNYSWEAEDGSLGNLFNSSRSAENTAVDGVTPLLASSDRRSTWPVINGEATWPGKFRTNLARPEFDVPGEFTSDRDIYCRFHDTKNLGISVEQYTYTYSRPYAEDLLFVRYVIHNESGQNKTDVMAGFQADLKADFYADNRIGAWSLGEERDNPTFIYQVDLNGIAQRQDSSSFEDNWEGPVGLIGMGLVKSPNDAGITSFHYFHDDESPVEDSVFAALFNNDASGVENPGKYFHGDNSAFDDIELWAETDLDTLPGSEITFLIASGPFDLPAGGSEEIAVLFAIGEDSLDLQQNAETGFTMAQTAFYQGSGPPATPYLTAYPGDGYVKLTWDDAAESSVDALTGRTDFEGYRLYKSQDQGKSWGEVLSNWYGDPVSFVPIFQCDLNDSITGIDPAFGADFPSAYAWLGDDTGLKHSFIDTDVTNGVETWYTITSYDKGVFNPEFPDSTEPSYECSRGISEFERNTVSVIPGTRAVNMIEGVHGDIIEVNSLASDGEITLEIVNHNDLTGATYQVTFNEVGDSITVGGVLIEVTEKSVNLQNLDTQSYFFTDQLTDEYFEFKNFPIGYDNLPVVDGFRLIARDIEGSGISSLGWTTVTGDSSTFDWWTENREPGNASSYDEVVEGLDDWRITVVDDSEASYIGITAAGWGVVETDSVLLPLKAERAIYSLGGQWEDVTDHLQVSDLQLVFPGSPAIGPYGWDLIPGGLGYNPSEQGGNIWPDMLVLRDDEDDSTGSVIYIKTQNGPASTIPPSVGDVYSVNTLKPFSNALVFEFTTIASALNGSNDLSGIKVVPNPYVVKGGFDRDNLESRVKFFHLPSLCEISIYTVAGQRVRTIQHQSMTDEGFTFWDLLNENGQKVAYGIYVYVVKTPDGKTFTDKLMIIR